MKYTLKKEIVLDEEIDILPCPFCKSDNLDVVHCAGSYGYSSDKAYVKCKSCGARGPVYTTSSEIISEQKKCAILAWNNYK